MVRVNFLTMKVRTTLIIAALLPVQILAQWEGFNQSIPISIQSPPFNYLQHGGFQNVFQIDLPGTFEDGYLLFGVGVLESPGVTSQFGRAFACKTNVQGDAMWWRRFENDSLALGGISQWINFRRGQGMVNDEFGRFISTYSEGNTTISEPWNRSKNYLLVMDQNAQILSQARIMHDTTYSFGYSGLLKEPSDSTFILHGSWRDSTMYFASQMPDAFLSKITSDGEVVWERHYDNTAGVWHVVKAMDGGYWVMASELFGYCDFNIAESNDDLILLKTDNQGIEESRIHLGGPCANEAATIVETAPDQVVLASRFTFDEQDNSWDFHGSVLTTRIEQTNGNGPLQEISGARKTYLPCQTIGYLADFYQIEEGYLLVGFTGSQPVFNDDLQQVGYILNIDENRDSVWARFYSFYNTPSPAGRARHWLWDSKLTVDGGLVCCGEIAQSLYDPNPQLRTPWVFKTDSYGCLEPGCQFVNVEEIVIGLEQSMTVYPNPARDRTNIRFDVPADFSIPDQSELVMIDLQGREIRRQPLSRSDIQSGKISFDLDGIPSGMYQVHWTHGNAWLDSVKLIVE